MPSKKFKTQMKLKLQNGTNILPCTNTKNDRRYLQLI